MDYKIVEKNNIKYGYVKSPLFTEADVLDIIGTCFGNDIKLIILDNEVLTEDFINLKTGLAGMTLQKFINYGIKAALIIEDENKIQGRFRELLLELNRGNNFRSFRNITDAEAWLLNSK